MMQHNIQIAPLDIDSDVNVQLSTLSKLAKSGYAYIIKTICDPDASRGKSMRSATRNTASPKPSRSSSNP